MIQKAPSAGIIFSSLWLFLAATFLACLFFGPSVSYADTSWISSAKTCDDFALGILRTYSSITEEQLSAEQRIEIREVMEAACREPYKSCNFSICKSEPQIPVTSGTPTVTREETENVKAVTAEPTNTAARSVDANQKSQNDQPRLTPTDAALRPLSDIPLPTPTSEMPLGWVRENMPCDTFLAELRNRFQGPRNANNLSAESKNELRLALDLACGEKFKHCNFEACVKTKR